MSLLLLFSGTPAAVTTPDPLLLFEEVMSGAAMNARYGHFILRHLGVDRKRRKQQRNKNLILIG